jgi:transmembrane sensor
MTVDDDLIPDPVLQRASAWALRLQAAPHDAALRADLAAWVAESDVNARAWRLTQKAWRLTGHAQLAFAHEWPSRQAPGPPAARPSRVRFGIRAAVLGLAACLLLVLALPSIQVRLAADYRTTVGESRRLLLEDGSTVHLASDSAIAVAFGASGREVHLLRGEAFFEVVPDSRRRFSVRAGDLSAIVTGTAFDVGLTEHSFSVAVAGGSVRVERAGTPGQGAVDLGPGQGVIIDRATGRPTDIGLPPHSVAAWRAGRLIVENAPLIDVVETIGRYHPGIVLVASNALREKRVTGVYDLGDPRSALRILSAPYGGTVRELTPWLLMLSAN